MKQILLCVRIAAAFVPETDAPLPEARAKAIRIRHSACGVSSMFVRRGEWMLAALEGGIAYVDRMLAALAEDGWVAELRVLAERPITAREYSQVALCLVDAATLQPVPQWAQRSFAELDVRAARRALRSLRTDRGWHAEPARASHLHSVQVGSLRA